jgi:tol-pal system protein YbgF
MIPVMRPSRSVLPLALALMLGTSALAQMPMDDPLDARDAKRLDRMEKVVRELRAIVFQGRDSGKPVVVQPAETDYQLQEMARRVADLEQSLTRINAELETSTRGLDEARRDAEALRQQNKALADRLAAIETAAAPAPAAEPEPEAPAPAPAASAGEAFTQARQLMQNGDYDAAEAAFQDYLARYGSGPRAPEARYWLGKVLQNRSAHADAATAYIGAIRGWPTTSWAPDATLELARSLIALKKPADACQALAELDKRYPKASAAVQSRAKTARIQAKCAA